MNVVRMTKHPQDASILLLDVPQHLNGAIGLFEPARLAPDMRGYLIHRDVVPALYRWARHHEVHIVDDRPVRGEHRPGHECAYCNQPGSVTHPPKVCPSCAKPWTPVTFRDTGPIITTTSCTSCGHRQTGRFPYCAHCGDAMIYDDPTARRPPLLRPQPRVHLDEPLPLAAGLPKELAGRPIEEVPLPEPEDA